MPFSVPVGHPLKSEKMHVHVGDRDVTKMCLALLHIGGFCGVSVEMRGRLHGIISLFVIKWIMFK